MDEPKIYPGEKLNDRERQALARDNERITREAMDRAHESNLSDRQAGRNPITDAARAIEEKVNRGEFTGG